MIRKTHAILISLAALASASAGADPVAVASAKSSIASAGADPVAVASAKSSIASASNDEVANLFLGKASSIGGASATPVGLKEGSAVRDAFYQKFAGKSADQAKAIISKQVFTGKAQPMREVGSDSDIKAAVGSDANAVGMIDSGSVDATVKVIAK